MNNWNSQSVNERKKVLDMILSPPVLTGVNIQLNLKRPFEILKEMKGNSEWRALRDSYRIFCKLNPDFRINNIEAQD